MRKITNLREALHPSVILKIILGCIIITDVSRKSLLFLNIIYVIGFWTGYFIAFYKVIETFHGASWYNYEEEILLIILYTQNCILLVNLVFEFLYQKRREVAIGRWSDADETLQQLGININYRIYYLEQIIMIGTWFILNTILAFIDMLWLKDKVEPLQNIGIIIVIQHAIHTNSLLESCFIMPIRHLALRYRLVNQVLEQLVARNCRDNFFHQLKRSNSEKILQIKVDVESLQVRSSRVILQIVKHIHLELTNINNELTDINGVKLTMASAGAFVHFTGLLYLIYLHVLSHPIGSFYDGRLTILLIWLVQHAFKFYFLNAACSLSISEFNKAKVIIHNLKIVTDDEELKTEIGQFSLQVMQARLDFEPCGLFTMGYNSVSSVAYSVTTLLVILMQISVMKPQSK